MNIKKRNIYTIITLLILIIGIFTVNALVNKEKAWHDSGDILVTVDGFNMTLQEAIYYNVFVDGATQSYTTEIPNPGHSADEIWISVGGDEKTLQTAILTIGLCGISLPSSSYINNISLGQFASEIEISPDTSLQDAINSGELVSVDGGWSGWSHPNAYDDGAGGTCSVECGEGTQTRTCTNPVQYCGGADCVGDSSQACNTEACEPSFWSGTGCDSQCPWGTVRETFETYGYMYYCKLGGGEGRWLMYGGVWTTWSSVESCVYGTCGALCKMDYHSLPDITYSWEIRG